MKAGEVTYTIHATDISEQIVGLMMEAPARIGLSCALHFRTLVGGRIATLHLTGTVAYCTLVGLKGYRVGIRMDAANRENADQLAMILSGRS